MDNFLEKIKEEIVEYLEKNGKSTLDDIHKEFNPEQSGLTYRDINKAIGEMKSEGQIQEYTYYGLRPKGCCPVPEDRRVNKKVSNFIKPSSDN